MKLPVRLQWVTGLKFVVFVLFMSRNTKRMPEEIRKLGGQSTLNQKSYRFSNAEKN
jgi:hypothetical protein